MNSWRIDTTLIDKTNITSTTSPIVGAIVVKSPKGPKDFKLFRKGDVSGVISTFGYPTKDYPSIQDAIDIVSKCDLWISSNYKNGKFGGVFVTPNGTVPFVNGVTTKNFDDVTEIDCEENIGIGDGLNVTFEKTVSNATKVDVTSMKILIDGTDTEAVFELDEGTTYTITAEGFSGTYDSSDGTLSLTWTVAPISGKIISTSYTIDMSDVLFILFNFNMESDDKQIKVLKSTDVDDAFEIYVRQYDVVQNEYLDVNNSPFTVGLSDTSKDNTGTNIYIGNIFNEDLGLFTPQVINSTFTTFTNDTTFKNLNGGNRGDDISETELASVYEELSDVNKFSIKFAVSSFASGEIVSKFETLRNESQKRCRFLYPTSNVTPSTIIADTSHQFDFGVTANRGLYQYCLTWGIHRDIYQGNDFMCSNIGLISGRLVDVLNAGGGVPAWIDENGVGGILGGSIVKLAQKATEAELQDLDKLGFNPVIMDNKFGAMIVSWRTRQVKENVYSFIGQSSLADTLIELIEQNVLPYRIGKLIDESSYSEVRNGCDVILKTYANFLEDYIVICSNENNDDETRASQTLVVDVGVIFKGYAQRVHLNFRSFKQGVNIQEEILKG